MERGTIGVGVEPSYRLLAMQVRELAADGRAWLGALANVSALLFDALPDVNWLGFYLVAAPRDGDSARELALGPFQGKVACLRIPFGRGVCGVAAQNDATLLVDDVHEFAGHIACDAASRSEIVVPLHLNGQVVAVLDVDSPLRGRFVARDQQGLELVARELEASAAFRLLAACVPTWRRVWQKAHPGPALTGT